MARVHEVTFGVALDWVRGDMRTPICVSTAHVAERLDVARATQVILSIISRLENLWRNVQVGWGRLGHAWLLRASR